MDKKDAKILDDEGEEMVSCLTQNWIIFYVQFTMFYIYKIIYL